MQVQSLRWEDSLEEEMATHSSIFLSGESSWTEEPGRLQSIVSHRVGQRLKRFSTQADILGLGPCTGLCSQAASSERPS